MVLSNKIEPELGSKKIKIKFAWLPTKLDDGSIIWLEKYYEEYEYTTIYYDTCPMAGWWRSRKRLADGLIKQLENS
jgi:hypothetical protein